MSARRGLPTLTLPAHPETAFDDKRDQGAGRYGRARDNLVAPVVALDAFINLRGGGRWYLARTSALVILTPDVRRVTEFTSVNRR